MMELCLPPYQGGIEGKVKSKDFVPALRYFDIRTF
jgi:hypothetical protein